MLAKFNSTISEYECKNFYAVKQKEYSWNIQVGFAIIDFIFYRAQSMFLIDFILHIDKHIVELVAQYGLWIYGILFLIIFVETGLVVMPLLPGDSLLFAAGAITATTSSLNPWVLTGLLIIAAILGDTLNYHIGKHIGPRVFKENNRFIRYEYLIKTQAFFEKHGGKTIIIARFMPIIRTFAPFVAGVGKMPYRYFISYNIIGAVLWISSFIWLGYLFGNQPIIKQNFSLVLIAIIIISVMPAVIEFIRHKRAQT